MNKSKQNVMDDQLTISQCMTQSSNSSVREYSDPIPIDLLIDIFSRVPSKSIARFRCVSKFWGSILLRPDFTELFLTKSLTRPRILLTFRVNEELFVFSSPQPQNRDDNSSPVATRYKYFPRYFPTEVGSSLCGLVFLHNIFKGNMLVICNPVTGESITLPRLKWKAKSDERSYFGFDPINKQFKVLYMTWSYMEDDPIPNTHWVLTLETGRRLWRKIQDPIFLHWPYLDEDVEICINGVLYYRADYHGSSIIVSFQVRTEKFGFINTDNEMSRWNRWTLFNYKGKLGATDFDCSYQIVLWVLEDVGKHKWSKIICALPPIWYNTIYCSYKFVGMTSTGEIVFSKHCLSNPFYIFYYNVERNSFTRVSVTGFEEFKHHEASVTIFLDYVENMKFM